MKRRTFAEKFSAAVASLSLTGCGDDEATSSSRSCSKPPPAKDIFDRIRPLFEEKMWTMVKLGVKEVNDELSFVNEEKCRITYKEINGGSWYSEMLDNLLEGIRCYGDPTDTDHDDYHHYYLNFYWCCYRAGMHAARLTVTQGSPKISTKDFERAMQIVHDTMEKLEKRGTVGVQLFACG